MKTDIHPTYDVTTVVCSCGNTFTTRSTKTGDAPRRALQRVPPVLHRQAEAGRHRWPRRALPAPLRPAQGRQERRRPGVTARPAAPPGAARPKLGALVRDHAGGAPVVLGSFGGGAALRARRRGVGAGRRAARAGPRAGAGLGPPAGRRRGVNVVVDDGPAAGLLARRAAVLPRPADGVAGRRARPASPAEPAPLPIRRRRSSTTGCSPSSPLIEAAGAGPVGRARRARRRGRRARGVPGGGRPRPRRRPARGRRRRPRPRGVPAHARRRAAGRGAGRRRREGRGRTAGPAPTRTRSTGWTPSGCCGGGWSRSPTSSARPVLEAAPPPVPRANLKDPVPCVAVGVDADGEPVVVVCSVGIDLDLVPFAADARLAIGPEPSRSCWPCPSATSTRSPGRWPARSVDPAVIVGIAARRGRRAGVASPAPLGTGQRPGSAPGARG